MSGSVAPPGSSTSRISGAWRNAVCPALSSTTSTAVRMARSRCARTAVRSTTSRSGRCQPSKHPQPDLRTTVLGTPLALPIILAPVGSSRMFYPRGEEAAARAAGDAGTLYTLVDAVGLPTGGRPARDDRPRVVSGLSVRRTRRGVARRSSARVTPGIPRWWSRSTPRSLACGSATCATGRRRC